MLLLFLLGAGAGLVGDHSHVVTGTTQYLEPSHAVPFVWSSPIWFALMVGTATVALAEVRLHLPVPRTAVSVRQGAAGVAAVVGTYALTALMHTAPTVPVMALIGALAVISYCVLGDRPAVVCGMLAAVIGPAIEIGIVAAGQFRYVADSDQLFGVAPWLVPLYFMFGVVAALLGEIAAVSPRTSSG